MAAARICCDVFTYVHTYLGFPGAFPTSSCQGTICRYIYRDPDL
jgi:hypothetical protein